MSVVLGWYEEARQAGRGRGPAVAGVARRLRVDRETAARVIRRAEQEARGEKAPRRHPRGVEK